MFLSDGDVQKRRYDTLHEFVVAAQTFWEKYHVFEIYQRVVLLIVGENDVPCIT